MPEFVRVKNKHTGSEFTLPASVALGDDVVQIDKPATNREGKPLPAKHKTNLKATAAEGNEPNTQKADTKATTSKKEQS